MDHRDRIESPSVERRKLLEKRMEMITNLINQMNEGRVRSKKIKSKKTKAQRRLQRHKDTTSVRTICNCISAYVYVTI